ncbi:peptidoglycan-binding domain-containing protein [Chelativorans sp. M5D2P16]|uniref:peptidoglycan-binding domain-containing protein n=1 Tax=Chelativorans sp. M5D2P16 TaxID=3095678 RepID=UPI002ACA1069|nr:peptidoglycan-binding domain-containing protein [Chelativorans sp. M5D2P16]MDZ5698368.1 peptidoglycan-binding domain-containing protein [Chelativorans sp. M5D2P16]
MKHYARAPERRRRSGWFGAGLSAAGSAVARNPIAVGGTTAFFVSLAFVSANALWYQPQMHPSAFVSTRASQFAVPEQDMAPQPQAVPREEARRAPAEPRRQPAPEPETTGSVAEDTDTQPAEAGDPTVRAVQNVLSELGLYRGPVDGLTGPQTRGAVETYRRIVGLEENGEIDAPLLQQLGLEEATANAAPPRPAPRPAPQADGAVQTASLDTAAAQAAGDPTVERVQAALKAFGNDDIEVDGVLGENTRGAIREFQSLFGLPVTGEPDEPLLSKMREIGLTN